ncbi:MAG: hypothetical protein P4L84_08595 [Isosphaeraceae bacterium]|nr:hypothetical protein [Isosphaeraceae bacterium]
MPLKRFEWNSRIKTVELDYRIARYAFDRLMENAQLIKTDFKYRDIARASGMLEATYTILLIAEFETGLRMYWETIRSTHPKTEDLLNGLAARLGIPNQLIEDAHLVREYRNDLIHEREDIGHPISIDASRDHLCAFFYRLPPNW